MATIATNAAAAREKLHHFIDEMEDERANSLFQFLKAEIDEEDDSTYTDEFIAELDDIEKKMKSGKMKVYNWTDVKKEMEEYINSKR